METIDDIVLRQQRRLRAQRTIVGDVGWLVAQPAGSLVWAAPVRDLIELVHVAWQQRQLVDRLGMPFTQRELMRRAFAVVGRRLPRNIAAEIVLIERRLLKPSMVERYAAMGEAQGCIRRFLGE